MPIDDAIETAIAVIGNRSFSTAELMDVMRDQGSSVWSEIVNQYGEGGKGSGRYYSAASFIAHRLDKHNRDQKLAKLDYRPAPPHWGNAVIRYWAADRAALGGTLYPDEIDTSLPDEIVEGAAKVVTVNQYERDPKAREQCIEFHGLSCLGCGFNFEGAYGSHGAGFIHVHHVNPLSSVGHAHTIDPKLDLVPLCPNCHAMVHYGPEMLTIEALKTLLSAKTDA